MPLEYFEIKRLLRSQISLFDSLTIKVLKYLSIYGFLFMFSIFGNVRNTNGSTIVVVLLLIMAIVYRFSILFERINLKNLTISF